MRKDIAQRWVDESLITPLLDALDVMAEDAQSRCVATINEYHRTHPNVSLVVCCRREQYAQLHEALQVRQAVMLLPLTDEAIDSALADCGFRAERLRKVVGQDAALRDVLRTPLMLSMAVLAADDLRDEAIPPVTDLDNWRRQLYSRYVRKMLDHRPGSNRFEPNYSEERFVTTLSWLGFALRKHNMNTLLLEQLQADWLPSAAQLRFQRLMRYTLIGSRAPVKPIAGTGWSWREALIEGSQLSVLIMFMVLDFLGFLGKRSLNLPILLGLLLVGGICVYAGFMSLSTLLFLVLAASILILAICVAIFVVCTLLAGMRGQAFNEDDLREVNEGIHRSRRLAISVGVSCGIGSALFAALLSGGIGALFNHLFAGMDWQVIIIKLDHLEGDGLVALQKAGIDAIITGAILMIIWSLVVIFAVAGFLTLVVGLLGGKALEEAAHARQRGFVIAGSITLFIASAAVTAMVAAGGWPGMAIWLTPHFDRAMNSLIQGLTSDALPPALSSFWLGKTLFVGFVTLAALRFDRLLGIILGCLAAAFVAVTSVLTMPLSMGLLIGMVVGLGVGLAAGGSATIKHYVLRLALEQTGILPPKLERFLSEAAKLVLLRRIGGGYQFIHQSVRDYFSDQYLQNLSPEERKNGAEKPPAKAQKKDPRATT
ncbi:MAG TPA: hypothetical protein VFU60_16865 [Ktedonobacterales bacterium]|nr:hypothetical protein [Ktedonobacterales bacterium]